MKTDYTPRDIYEFILLSAPSNGMTQHEANIIAVRTSWKIFSILKMWEDNGIYNEFKSGFFEWVEHKER